jgi:UDP-N-acetylmuramoylalanine--D-glutamate ligase
MNAACLKEDEAMGPEARAPRGLELSGRRVLVVGMARSGLAAVEFLLGQGARVVATDRLPEEKLDPRIRTLAGQGATLALGGHQEKHFLEADLIVVSPGVPAGMAFIEKAVAAGVPVVGELELASWFVEVPMVAVTGTNGKTTTTRLIGELLRAGEKRGFVGGNIGNPLVGLLLGGERVDAAVVEVSSFQLETVRTFHPQVAVHLNLTPDHLDRHGDLAAYGAIKARLFACQEPADTAVLNADDPAVAGLQTRARRLMFSRLGPVENGAFIDRDRIRVLAGGRDLAELELRRLSLPGRHNQENVMAGLLAVLGLGLPLNEAVLEAAARFQGLPHRLEFVGLYEGVRYFDDSKATNVGAVIQALEAFEEKVVLIAGGLDKGVEFESLRPAMAGRVKNLILIGQAREKMARALGDLVETVMAADMAEAVSLARRAARPGDVVLLAPACASFDMFDDYAHRGRVFADLAQGRTV